LFESHINTLFPNTDLDDSYSIHFRPSWASFNMRAFMFPHIFVILLTSSTVAGAVLSICDKYTTGLFDANNAANQLTFITRLVNTAFVGNYYGDVAGALVTGILNPTTVNGTAINLLPYFDGSLNSTKVGGASTGSFVNFLDDGGKVPLSHSKPSNGDKNSKQK
jgi:hypothetical protein